VTDFIVNRGHADLDAFWWCQRVHLSLIWMYRWCEQVHLSLMCLYTTNMNDEY